MIAVSAFAVLINTFLAKRLPLVQGLVMILHILGLFAVIIPLWTLAPRSSARAVFTEFRNDGGWSSTGLSAMVGLLVPTASTIGYGCVVL